MARFIAGCRTAALCFATYALLITIFTGLTLLHGRIDPDLTHENMVTSLEAMDDEGNYPNIGIVIGCKSFTGFEGEGNIVDNYTNMWMIQSADSQHFFDEEEFVKGIPYDSENRAEIPGDVNAQAFSSGWRNGSYWSGYRIFMKPLLLVMDVRGLRIVQLLVVLVSLIWAAMRVGRDIGMAESVLLLCSLFLINPLNTVVDFDQAPDLIQALLSVVTVLWMLRRGLDFKWFSVFFLALGAIEAFINCLIMPLITLGLPLIAYVLVRAKSEAVIRRQITDGVKLSISWCLGYAGSFFSVWIISALFQGESCIAAVSRGFAAFFGRAGGDEGSLVKSIMLSVHNNLNLNVSFIWVLIAVVFVLIVSIRIITGSWSCHRACVPLLSAGILPFIWILVLNNHSRIHSWMVHDIFAITIWALLCCILYLGIQWLGNCSDGAVDGGLSGEGI